MKRMGAMDFTDSRHVVNIRQLRRQMRENPSMLWFNDTYESIFSTLVSDSVLVLHPNETPDGYEDMS
jgi:hypothetical protein